MITIVHGDLLNSNAQALVNAVNTVGVMGKGIALQFKMMYPFNYNVYKEACMKKELKIGQVLVVKEEGDESITESKYIINFPTKQHWKSPSKLEYIELGLYALKDAIKKYDIKSISLPPLGCGNGGLDWNIVKPMIIESLEELEDVEINIYE